MSKLRHVESMTAGEVFDGRSGKDYKIEELPEKAKRAKERLEARKLDDQDTISCLRFSGERRLWGFRHDNVFHVLWWDPRHEVWPSSKKHT
ncbi:MAG: hypothetical protein ACRDPW_10690 [Mycobacteriales bacterium]